MKQRRTKPSIHQNFGIFIKEGICTTKEESQKVTSTLPCVMRDLFIYLQKALAKLVRFSTNKTESTSLEAYVSRMPESQKSIYYLTAPSAAIARDSPYLAQFEQNNVEVIFMLEQVDEFVASHIQKFKDFDLTHVEKGRSELTSTSNKGQMLPNSETLGKAVSSVKVSTDIPETLAGHLGEHESPMMRNLMKQLNRGGMQEPLPVKLELNAYHPIILGLNVARKEDISEERISEMENIARQVLDSAAISAGTLEDPRSMLKRLNLLCLNAVKEFIPVEANVIEETPQSPENSTSDASEEKVKKEVDPKVMQA
jgi:HSP90 family molecular chaperone